MSGIIMQGLSNDMAGLGRFNNHPDPATDFCIQVEKLTARLFDAQHGLSKPGTAPEDVTDVLRGIETAMEFVVGGDLSAVEAKAILRDLEAEATAHIAARNGGGR
ncbi:hypothetical protein D1114_07285 [Cereibacter sphaeroides]|uniref:Uncharacterized protein n=1 Tax=Cereibacter sphaeroides TaxID=1063 RepID=A0AAX1UP19_CERSP|nr:hypothetical protein [Cereibacter sphaeroides]RHZ96504.1 hypothetical protein D1114_07285 [Cereibacter sphaeroides]